MSVVRRYIVACTLFLTKSLALTTFFLLAAAPQAYASPSTVQIEIAGLGVNDGNPSSPFNLPLNTTLTPGQTYKVLLTGRDNDADTNNQPVNNITFDLAITNGTLTSFSWLVTGDIDDNNLTNSIPGVDNPGQVSTDTFSGHSFPTQALINAGFATPLQLGVAYFTAGAAGSPVILNFDSNPYVSGFATDNSHYGVNGTSYGINGGGAVCGVNCLKFQTNVGSAGTAPSITTQPANQTVTAPATATFSVSASGTAPLSYQWQKNGTNISGATSSSYTTPSTTTADSGSVFRCVVSNSAGSATSNGATLTVNAAAVAPTITTPPQSATINAGQNASFSVVASGTAPLSYQWKKGGVNISGATSATYSITNAQSSHAGSYTVSVSNSAGSVTSSAATLTVNVSPTITSQPQSLVVTAGQPASFSVTTSGTAPLSYQWKKGGVNISGATSATFTIANAQAADAASYTVVVSNMAGNATSTAATLTVNPAVVAPTITQQPQNLTVNSGQAASFSVTASGTAPLSYQWKKGGVNISGATSATFTIASAQSGDAASYTVLVSNSAGNVTSSAATLTVNISPTISTQPQNLTVNAGQAASFSVVASGTAPLSYQWKKGGVNISGGTSATYTIASAQAADAASYTVTVSNVAGSVTSNAATLTVNVSPAITTQPQSLSVTAGQPASFSVVASGTAPLSYQWKKGGVNISGATAATFSIANAQAADAASYTVVVSNVVGNVTSNAAMLTVNAAPVAPAITQQPQSLAVNAGQLASFTVGASGTAPLSYQWKKGGVNISGATSATFTIASAQAADAASYTVFVSNVAGSVTSNAATLTLNVAPSIAQQPQGLTLNAGQSATFSVVASGTAPLSYQWKKNGTNISGATAASYNIPSVQSADAANYTVTVSNIAGNVTSNQATLVVNISPAITTQPQNLSVTAGQSASFSVVASGTAPLSYQWKKGGVNISGATAATFNIANAQAADAASYTVVVSNVAGSVTSNAATLTVNPAAVAPAITQQPQSLVLNPGQAASFTVAASGTAPLSYQWKKNGTNISGATAATFTIASAQSGDAASYTVLVSNVAGSVTSNAATLTVNVSPAITTQPQSLSVIAGQPASFSVVASGTAPLSYQWKKGGVNISGATAATFNIANAQATDAASYTVVVSNVAGNVTSNAAALTVNPAAVAPVITQQPQTITVNPGQSASFTVVASGTAPLSYQWKKGGVNISGGTSATYTIASAQSSDAANYTVVVSNSAGSSTSNTATLFLNVVPSITQQPQGLTVNVGQSATFSVVASGTAPLSYQWKKNGTNISGATAASYNIPSAQSADAASYTVSVSNIAGNVTSNQATLVVNVPPAITQQPQSLSVIAGQAASFSVIASGAAPLSYQWKKGGVNISGATGATFNIPNAQAADAASYTVVVSNVAGNVTSNAATLTVNPAAVAPAITQQPQSLVVNLGQSASFTVSASGTAPLSYQWKKGGVNISGATAATFTIAHAQSADAASYTVAVSNSAGSATSNAVTLTVNIAPTITQQPQPITVVAGNQASFSVVASGTAPLSYQWKKNGTNISGATAATYSIASAQSVDAANYTVAVSNVVGTVISDTALLTVNPASVAPTITQQPQSLVVVAGQSASFTVVASGTAPLSYQWKKNGVNISGATSATYTIANAQAANAASYTVAVSNVAGSTLSNAATLTVNPAAVAPTITQQPQSLTVTAGQPASFSVSASGTAPLSYQWKKAGVNISGATTATFTIANAQAADAASYTVVVSNSAGSITSSGATLTVNPAPIAPTITQQPQSLTVNTGQSAAFSVVASGTAPLSYQWKKNGTNISGATASTYSIASVQISHAGNYSVTVSNAGGSVTSFNASLTVNQPTYTIAGLVTFGTVGLGGVTVSDGTRSAITSSMGIYVLTNVPNGSYTLTATLAGYTIQPSTFVNPVIVNGAPVNSKHFIATQSAYAIMGNVFVGTTGLSGVTVTDGFRTVTTNASGGYTILGVPNGSYTLTARLSGYDITPLGFANPVAVNGINVSGKNFTAQATSAPMITGQPQSQSAGEDLGVTLSVTATGSAPMSYQWYKRKGSSDVQIAGETSNSFTINAVEKKDAGKYRVRVQNALGSVMSNYAVLTVVRPPGDRMLTDGSCIAGVDCLHEALNPTACAGVNGFFEQINIASIINLKSTTLGAKVTYRDSSGQIRGTVNTSIAPLLKKDIIANELGMVANSYGTVCVETNAADAGAWMGGVTIYKENARPGQAGNDYALYYPFRNPQTAENFTIPLNTFHIGTKPSSIVANWIQVSDATPNDGYSLRGRIDCYNNSGSILRSYDVNIPNGGRRDFSGHECLAGSDNDDAIGTAQFVVRPLPNGSYAEYYITSSRYFHDTQDAAGTHFLSAFVIPPRPATSEMVTGGVSTFGISVIELNNPLDEPASVSVRVFDSIGNTTGITPLTVPPFATRHIVVNKSGENGYLANDRVGSARITVSSGKISALSLFYKMEGNKLVHAYAVPFLGIGATRQLSEFNSFLQQQNDFEFYNSTSETMSAHLDILDYSGRLLSTSQVSLLARSTQRVTLSVPDNTYGTLVVRSSAPGIICRNHVFPKSKDQYVLPFICK